MPTQAIYFDLGNVLLGFSHERMCQQMADVAGLSAETVRRVIFDAAASRERSIQWLYESGQIGTDEYYAHFCKHTGTRPDRRRLELAACDIFWPLAEMIELVERLAAAGNRIGVLSNINVLHWGFVADGRFPLFHAAERPSSPLQWAVLSYKAGAMKPNRAIYDFAVGMTGAPAGDVLFIDDRGDNVAGARSAGLDAIEFVGIAPLLTALQDRGIRGL
jgi:FMN phosphatase YigB (HAD superfamily)